MGMGQAAAVLLKARCPGQGAMRLHHASGVTSEMAKDLSAMLGKNKGDNA